MKNTPARSTEKSTEKKMGEKFDISWAEQANIGIRLDHHPKRSNNEFFDFLILEFESGPPALALSGPSVKKEPDPEGPPY